MKPLFGFIPRRIWYKLKCFFWHRYTTVKPRWLKYHTWCDKDYLLAYASFEILARFIEKECSPGIVEWYGSQQYMVKVRGKMTNVRSEMQVLYDWWLKTYLKKYDQLDEQIWAKIHPIEKMVVKNSQLKFEHKNEEDKQTAKRLYNMLRYLEIRKERELDNMLCRLMRIRQYMWT